MPSIIDILGHTFSYLTQIGYIDKYCKIGTLFQLKNEARIQESRHFNPVDVLYSNILTNGEHLNILLMFFLIFSAHFSPSGSQRAKLWGRFLSHFCILKVENGWCLVGSKLLSGVIHIEAIDYLSKNRSGEA